MSVFGLNNVELPGSTLGHPFEIYEFIYGNKIYLYNTTASEIKITIGLEDVTTIPAPISREAITLTSDIRRAQIVIHTPSNFEIANLFKTGTPASQIWVRIRRANRHRDSVTIEWFGRVVAAEWAHSGAKLFCESYYSAIQGNSNMRYYGYLCPHALFGERCKVNRENYRVTAVISGLDGNSITSPVFATKPDHYFTGGYIVFSDDDSGIQHRQHINSHYDDTIKIVNKIPKLSVGKQIEVYPGCNRTLEECKNKFENHLNFGGFPWIPGRNPFTSPSSIF